MSCETPYWVCQDANFNVLSIIGSDRIAERYEYTPYGERSVFKPTQSCSCLRPLSASPGNRQS